MTTSAPRATAPRLVLLDGLRGIAAIGTVLFHMNMDGSVPAFARGYLFVDFFFLLSGFVLTLAFEPRFFAGLDWRQFLTMRFVRFWPLVALATTIGGVAAVLAQMPPLALTIALLAGITMVPIPATGMLFPLNAPQWSLLFELLMNLLHGLLFWRLRERTLWAAIAGLGLATAAATWALDSADHGSNGPEFVFAAVRTAFSYALGIAFARIWKRRSANRKADWRLALLLPPLTVVTLALVPHPAWIGDAMTLVLLLPALFWLAASADPPRWTHRPLTSLGALSFPLYALHFPLLTLWALVAGPEASPLFALPLILAIAAASARLLPPAGFRRKPRPILAAA